MVSVDEDQVHEMIHACRQTAVSQSRSYAHLMRCATRLFEPQELERFAPRSRGGPRLDQVNGRGLAGLDPIAATEAIAYAFLSKGGKHSRPFITLAVYDALTGGRGTLPDGEQRIADFPVGVKRTAMSIETFHKASLVHDDIEDDDAYRYGEETLHRRFGTPTAINVGDYLIGMGYRLVSREAASLGPEVAADILDCLAESHTRLSEGQGAELLWRDSLDKRLTPPDALKIYALKTAPAFEAALYCGARLAGPVESSARPMRSFARNLGVAFQILNDLKDWRLDDDNKLSSGGDLLGGRPTVLWALALQGLAAPEQAELIGLIGETSEPVAQRIRRARELYQQAQVFDQAFQLVYQHRRRAEAAVRDLHPEPLQDLLHYLVEAVLAGSTEPLAEPWDARDLSLEAERVPSTG